MNNNINQKVFDGTIGLKPYKFHAMVTGDNDIIILSIFQEEDKVYSKDEPEMRIGINKSKNPKWEILRAIGGLNIAISEMDKVAEEAIKQLGI